MSMTSRERMLTALSNERPDRLPCQVHGWMEYYLDTYLGGMDWWQANEKFDMDYAMYVRPGYIYSDNDQKRWQVDHRELGKDNDGNSCWEKHISTPEGTLYMAGARNQFTGWETEHICKTEKDFELYAKYSPLPIKTDMSLLMSTKDRLGDKGIIRSHPFYPGQGSPWQAFCFIFGTEPAIYMTFDKPDFVHHALDALLQRSLRVIELWEGTPADMVETDGGAGSSTVISPDMFREFCLPYNQKQNDAFRELGIKTVCHLCGGLMPMLDLVVESGADGLETMTPKSMGGDCDLAKASEQVGDKLFFIGGFDQNAGFENGTPEAARQQVLECFEATKDHAGYIIAPSDHFFHGDPACLKAFADACKECIY